ncbi:MAG: hypothetical protein AAGK37_02845 [Pseudomonadota bacterium]
MAHLFGLVSYRQLTPLVVAGPDLLVASFLASVASFQLMFAAAELALGPVSDGIGRRHAILGCLAIFAAGHAWSAVSGIGVSLIPTLRQADPISLPAVSFSSISRSSFNMS